MPRTVIAMASSVRDSSIAAPATTVIDAALVTNGLVVESPNLNRLMVTVNNTAATAKLVTIRAGANPPASLGSQGDLVGSVGNAATREFGPLTSGRFMQPTGHLHIDFKVGTTGFVTVRQAAK